MDIVALCNRLYKVIDEKVNTIQNCILDEGARDFVQYKFLQGQRKALLELKQEIKDLLKNYAPEE